MRRYFYVLENSKNEYFKGKNREDNVSVYTPLIEEARFFTHLDAVSPRVGERIVKIAINVHSQNVEICES